MKTTDNSQSNAPANQQKEKKVAKQREPKLNQAIFIHYEVPRFDGHIETVMDSYRNRLGRIYEHFDTETDKFEFTFKNHAGEVLFKSDDLVRLREQIISNKKEMMRDAHERRISQKQQKGKTILPPAKDVQSAVEKTVNQSRDVVKTVHDFVGGQEDSRAEEMKQLRERKQQRSRGISR